MTHSGSIKHYQGDEQEIVEWAEADPNGLQWLTDEYPEDEAFFDLEKALEFFGHDLRDFWVLDNEELKEALEKGRDWRSISHLTVLEGDRILYRLENYAQDFPDANIWDVVNMAAFTDDDPLNQIPLTYAEAQKLIKEELEDDEDADLEIVFYDFR